MTKAISVPLIDYPTPDIQRGLDRLLNDWYNSQTCFWEQKKTKKKHLGTRLRWTTATPKILGHFSHEVFMKRDHCNEN